MQVEKPNARLRAQQTVAKSQDLFDSKKYYQYGQKIKLFAHRKLQGNKVSDGLYILQLAAIKLLEVGEDKQGQELISQWLKSLEDHKQAFSIELFNSYIQLYSIKPTHERASQLQRLVKTFKDKLDIPHKQQVNKLLTTQYIRKGQYAAAEKYAVYQQLSQGEDFLKQWSTKLENNESQFIRLRFGLLKILYQRQEQGQSVISKINSDSPFKRFADSLIQSFKANSRQAFQKIGKSYSYFIADPSVGKIYWALGYAIFGVQNPNSGPNILSIFQ